MIKLDVCCQSEYILGVACIDITMYIKWEQICFAKHGCSIFTVPLFNAAARGSVQLNYRE